MAYDLLLLCYLVLQCGERTAKFLHCPIVKKLLLCILGDNGLYPLLELGA